MIPNIQYADNYVLCLLFVGRTAEATILWAIAFSLAPILSRSSRKRKKHTDRYTHKHKHINENERLTNNTFKVSRKKFEIVVYASDTISICYYLHFCTFSSFRFFFARPLKLDIEPIDSWIDSLKACDHWRRATERIFQIQ